MNARTLMISAGAVIALAAPSVANARMLPAKQPSKHVVKQHAAKQQVTKRQGQPRRVIYIYYPAPAPVVQAATSLEQLQQDYNNDLIAHGLAPIDFDQSNTPEASETPSPAPETPSPAVQSDAAPASFAAASTSGTVTSTATDDADC